MPDKLETPPYIGKWAVLSYYVPDNLMHPEDAKEYLEGGFKGESLYKCTSEDGKWVALTNNKGKTFHVNPSRVLWVPEPEYDLGQEVETTNGTYRVGKICIRDWHFKKKRFAYFIEILNNNNRKIVHKRRYWSSDLAKTTANK